MRNYAQGFILETYFNLHIHFLLHDRHMVKPVSLYTSYKKKENIQGIYCNKQIRVLQQSFKYILCKGSRVNLPYCLNPLTLTY